MITRKQEIECWKVIARSHNLKLRPNGTYRGDCPFCAMPRIFRINIDKNYAECLACGSGGYSLASVIKSLMSVSLTSSLSTEIVCPSR